MAALEVGKIHPTAQVDASAIIGANVTIGAFSSIGAGVELGEDSVVGSHSLLGEPQAGFYTHTGWSPHGLTIGSGALIRSHSVIYDGSRIGTAFECGHRVTIREASDIGDHVRIGTSSDVQGDCQIGNYVRLHSGVFIASKCRLADHVWVFPHVVLTNDPRPPSEHLAGVTIERFAAIAARAVLLPGVVVGHDALVGAGAVVRADVEAMAVVVGNPARQVATVDRIIDAVTGKPAYPWRFRFDRGMPWEGIGYDTWQAQGVETP